VKIRPVGAELFHSNGRTEKPADLTKLTGVFRQRAEQWRSFLIFVMCPICFSRIQLLIFKKVSFLFI